MRLFPNRQTIDRPISSNAKAREASPPNGALEKTEKTTDQKRRSFPWQPFLIGGLAFWLVTGGTILRPGNLHWLLHGDHATYLLGWMFFRNAPILQQPLGANWPYGMEMSSSIIYPDGVPLMALLLKPFKALLPEHFQYFGIWILICYLLQSFFAWKLVGRITDRVWHKVFGTLFFVLAPPFVWRLLPHFGLGSHWLLLASLYLYFSPRLPSRSWILLVILSSLINPYLLAMTMLFFGAALLKHYTNGELNRREGFKTVAITAALLLFVMWEAGYFMVSTVGTGGFGYFRASVLTFLNPCPGDLGRWPGWSHFLKGQPKGPGDYEGFGFLGTGTILLSLVAVGTMLCRGVGSINWRKLWPLFLVFSFSVLFAFSNNLAIGPHVIFHYDVPPILERFTDALRASGRFIWPAYYILITAILAMVFRGLRPPASLALIGFCAVVQVAESWEALSAIRSGYQIKYDNKSGNHPTVLNSSFWRRVAEKYRKIKCVFPAEQAEPQDQPENYFPLCLFAATHHLAINMGYLARVDEKKLETVRANLLHVIAHAQLDPEALYVFQNAALWGTAALRVPPGDWVGLVDGFKIIAPAWEAGDTMPVGSTLPPGGAAGRGDGGRFGKTTLPDVDIIPKDPVGSALRTDREDDGGRSDPAVALSDLFLEHHFLEYNIGTQLGFTAGDKGTQFLGIGWSQPEPWGTWSEGNDASILLMLDREPGSDAILELNGNGFVSANWPEQEIDVSVNGTRVGELTYTLQNSNASRSIHVPREPLLGRRGLVEIQFRFNNPVSPARLGLSPDSRNLALGLTGLTLK